MVTYTTSMASDCTGTATGYTTDSVWTTWTISYSTGSTVWVNWIRSGTIHASNEGVIIRDAVIGPAEYSTSTSSTSAIWGDWVHAYVETKVETKEEKQTRLQREEEQRRQAEEMRKKREAQQAKALVTAEELLEELIGEEEMAVFRQTGRLLVKGHKHDYLLHRSGKVQRVEKDKIVDLCVHLQNRYSYVDVDNVIALKCAIDGNEESFNREAHRQGSQPRPAELPLAANG